MKKVGFFQSIHLKLVIIYMLLILIAMQVIGVYFVGKLEKSLVDNFQSSIRGHVNLLSYSVGKEMSKGATATEDPSLEKAINMIQKL